MSTESLALLRQNAGQEISALAEEHIKHDLQDSDRDLLNSAASKFGTHVKIGSLLGLSLGALLAFRLRRTRLQMFRAFRAQEKPTHVRFADGREGKFSGRVVREYRLTSALPILRSRSGCYAIPQTLYPWRCRCVYFLWLRWSLYRW
jgi:hypothetical protein